MSLARISSLKMAIYILNRVPSNSLSKIPFNGTLVEKFNSFYVLGCPTEVKIYNPHKKKLTLDREVVFFGISWKFLKVIILLCGISVLNQLM